jgi:hypothetical protein
VSTADDKRAIERFIAGLATDEQALADALWARAVDRAIVVDALLDALAGRERATRLTAARRVTGMASVAAAVAARLMLLAVEDDDPGVRDACADALRAHGLRVPGDPADSG